MSVYGTPDRAIAAVPQNGTFYKPFDGSTITTIQQWELSILF